MPSVATARNRLAFLDFARGAAALLVLGEHGLQMCVPGYLEFSRVYIVIGQAAILVFFMISGFVIPMSLEQGNSVTTFWVRRFFRLFPVYWLSISLAFAYLCVGGPLPLDVQLADTTSWLANLTLLQGCLGRPNVWVVFWSLHFELVLYVFCSALFSCKLLHRIGTRTFLALLAGFAIAFSTGTMLMGKPPGNGDMRLVILAALFGFIAQRYTARRMSRATFYWLLTGIFTVVLFMWSVNHLLFPSVATWIQLMRWVVVVGVAYGTFVCLLEVEDQRLPRVGVWIGRRSYPIYLLHPFVLILLLPRVWPIWAFMPCLVCFTLLLAELAHRLVERPGIALGRRLIQRPKIAG